AGTIVVGSQAYYSNEIIAELFAQVLEKAGLTVDRQYQIGQREVYLPELESGALDVMPEYTGNLLQNYEPDAESASPEEIHSALSEVLPDGLRLLPFAEATDQDSYTTTSDFASSNSLTTIADLAGLKDLKIAANSEFEVRPYGPEGVKTVYGVDVTVVPVEDGGGPLTVQALTDGDVQLADLYTSDPAIIANDLVPLEDPEALILPQNVVPVVSKKVDDDAAAAITTVIEALSADDLVELNRRSVEEQASSADIAKGWLGEKGLV
ncbi:MAG: ABC transporter substrate-binding protein, partial [Brachybacterium tyrofermentans]